MFSELMPLIENRPLTITVAALSEGRIRVNVVPQALAKDSKVNEKIGYANKDKIAQVPESAIHALTTPLSLTGTPEEIDAELAQQLKAFVDSHQALQQSVDEAKQKIAEAVKAIEERDKTRSKAKTTTVPKADDTNSGQKSEEAKIASDNLSLFEGAGTTSAKLE
jgi:PRTRC genetic system protein E